MLGVTSQGRPSATAGRACLPALVSVPGRCGVADRAEVAVASHFGNNLCWYDPTRGVTIATGISAWADSGASAAYTASAKDIAQGTGSAQPTRVLDAYNLRPVARFSAAASQCLTRATTNLFGSGAYTICVVMQTTSNNQGVWDCASLNAGCGFFNNGIFRSSAHYGVAAFDDGAAGSVLESFVVTRASGAKPKMFLNGAEQVLSGASTTLNDPGGGAAITMGARGDSGSPATFFTGDIAEVLAYSADAPVYVRRLFEARMCARYARDFTLWGT